MLNDVHDANSIWSKDSDLKAFSVSNVNMEGVYIPIDSDITLVFIQRTA
jgi:hypothetical protein